MAEIGPTALPGRTHKMLLPNSEATSSTAILPEIDRHADDADGFFIHAFFLFRLSYPWVG